MRWCQSVEHHPEHDTCQCPREESNLRTRFRKPLLYPLSYEGKRKLVHTRIVASGVDRIQGSGDCDGGE